MKNKFYNCFLEFNFTYLWYISLSEHYIFAKKAKIGVPYCASTFRNPEVVPVIIVPGEPLLLGHSAVNGDGGEVLFDQQLGHGDTALHGLHEDHHLGKRVEYCEMKLNKKSIFVRKKRQHLSENFDSKKVRRH